MRNRKMRFRFASLVLLSFVISTPAFAAKVKKKDGQIVEGTIKGLIAQRGKDTTANAVTYNVIKGEYVESINESGIHLLSGKKFLYLLTRRQEVPDRSEEAEIIGVMASFFDGFGEDSQMAANIGVGGGVAGKYVDGRELTVTDVLLGTRKLENKTYVIVPSLEIVTVQGSIKVPVNEIVEFKKNS